MLYHDRKTHYNSARQGNSFINKFYSTELNITDAKRASVNWVKILKVETNPFERRDSLSVTILESITVPSPSLSSKKYPKSRAVKRAASWDTKTDRASESSSLGSSGL